MKMCQFCNRKLKYGKKYCSIKCQHSMYRVQKISDWKANPSLGIDNSGGVKPWLRNHLKKVRGDKCEFCGWHEINPITGHVPIEVDHIDGNYNNCTEENLRLLCPNCHSLTPTFRALNMGNGRILRRKAKKDA